MKHLILPALMLGFAFTGAAQGLYEENFDAYAAGDGITDVADPPYWILWSNDADEQAYVTSDQYASAPNSLEISGSNIGSPGGPLDVVNIGPLDGAFNYQFSVLVPQGSSGYYNFQESSNPGQGWPLNCWLNSNGLVLYTNEQDDSLLVEVGFTPGEWLTIRHQIDCDSARMDIFFDETFVGQFPFNSDEWGGINYFALGDDFTAPLYYVDDIVVTQADPVGLAGCTNMEACNYDANAVTEDGSCAYPGDSCDDMDPATSNDVYSEDCECAGVIVSVAETSLQANVFPNPAKNSVWVKSNLNTGQVVIYGLDGRIAHQEQRNDLQQGAEILLTLQDGLYLLEVTDGKARKTQRLLIQK